MTKVRFLKEGGNPKEPEKKDDNLLAVGDTELDRGQFTNTFRDFDDFSGWADKYRGLSGNKIRNAVASKAREMANAVLNGDMTIDQLTTFSSNNKGFESDGKTKKRFLGGYDSRDANTVNGIAARYLLDVMGRSKYNKKNDTEGDGATGEELPKYEFDALNYILGKTDTDRQAAISAYASFDDRGQRIELLRSKLNPVLSELSKAKDSGKYDGSFDFDSAYNRYNEILGYLKDYDTYNANKAKIAGLDTTLYGTIAELLGEGKQEQKATGLDAEIEEEKKKAELKSKEDELEKLRRSNAYSDYSKSVWNGMDPNYVPSFVVQNAYRPGEGFNQENIYKYDFANNRTAYNDYINHIVSSIANMYNDYSSNVVDKFPNDESRSKARVAYLNSAPDRDKYLGDHTGKSRDQLLQQYVYLLSKMGVDQNTINGKLGTTYDDNNKSMLVWDNGTLRRMNLRQAVDRNLIPKAVAESVIREAWMNKNGEFKEGGVLKAQRGMALKSFDQMYSQDGPAYQLSPEMDEEMREYALRKQAYEQLERKNKGAVKTTPEERVAREMDVAQRVIDRKGNLKSEEAKKAMQQKTSFSAEDWARLSSAALNLTSAITAFTGFSPAAGAIGVGGTIANAVADKMDDSVSTGEWWKNLGINAGLDVLSFVPFLGTAAAGTKVMRIARAISPVIGAMAIMNTDFADTASLVKKVADGGWKSMSRQEWVDLMNGISQISGLAKVGSGAVRGYRVRSRAAADSGKSQISIMQNGQKKNLNITNDQWNEIQRARYSEDGRTLSDGKAIIEQNKVLKKLFGDDVELSQGVLKSRWGMLPSTRREVYDYEYESAPGRKWYQKRVGDVISETTKRSRMNGVEMEAKYDVGRVENQKPLGAMDRMKKTTGKVKDKVTKAVSKNKLDGVGTLNGDEYKRTTIKSGKNKGKQIISKKNKTTGNFEEVANPSSEVLAIDFKRFGGKVLAVNRYGYGGAVRYMQNGGATVRNTYSKPEPMTYRGYTGLWGKTVGKSLHDRLSALKDEDIDKFISDTNSIQNAYKGAVDVSGTGYNQTSITRHDEVGSHQKLFNELFSEGNTSIENAYNDNIISRRGNTGDNAASGFVDNLHGLQNSLRTIGAAFNDEDRAAFEASDEYKRIRELAAMKGMTYAPIKDISGNGKYYYGFTRMGDTNAGKPSSITGPDEQRIPDELKQPGQPSGGGGNVNGDGGSDGNGGNGDDNIETNPSDMKEKGNGRKFNPVSLLALAEPIAATIINNKAVEKAKSGLRPNLVDAYRIFVPVENDYWAKRNAEESAARMERAGFRMASGTADGALGNASWLKSVSKGEDAIREGNYVSQKRFYDTRDKSVDAENENKARWTQAANTNRAAMNGIKALKANMDANRMTGNYNGIWKPWLQERRANAMQAGKLRQAQEMQQWNLTQQELFREGIARESGSNDPTEQNAWLATGNGRKWYAEFQRNRLNGNPAYKSVESYINASDYMPVFARSGARIKSSYSMNLGLDTFSKEFFKSARNDRTVDTRERIASTSGARKYVTDMAKNVNDYNRMMSYARRRK